MANPDITSGLPVYGRTTLQNVVTTATAIASNATNSNKVFKINALVVTNVVSADVLISADIFRGGVATRIAFQIIIPPGSSIVLTAKENPFYLMEGDSLRLQASVANAAEAMCSFEEFG